MARGGTRGRFSNFVCQQYFVGGVSIIRTILDIVRRNLVEPLLHQRLQRPEDQAKCPRPWSSKMQVDPHIHTLTHMHTDKHKQSRGHQPPHIMFLIWKHADINTRRSIRLHNFGSCSPCSLSASRLLVPVCAQIVIPNLAFTLNLTTSHPNDARLTFNGSFNLYFKF